MYIVSLFFQITKICYGCSTAPSVFVTTHCEFFTLVVFHWSLNASKSPQVSRTLQSILSDLSNTEVWMFSILPPISNFSCLFS